MKLKSMYKKEKDQEDWILACIKDNPSVQGIETLITDWYYQVGRISVVEDLIKQKFGYQEREFQIRKKNGTLFEKVK